MKKLENLRNIGISAHIDSGKTTLTERILYYAGRIHKIEEVRGSGSGATMDHMELEKERGITITSAATSVGWGDHSINIIDTPGHVDFTVEVERSLRVLDGAILVLCSVGGVQSQSITVDRQMKRYKVPAIAFINKLDRSGANPTKVIGDLNEKLHRNAVAMQLPIGLEADHKGVVDLVQMRAIYFEGERGEDVRYDEIPAELVDDAQVAREEMLDKVSMFSDDIMEKLLEGEEIPAELIYKTVKEAVLTHKMTPVFMGSAFKNFGVQALLDAVIQYLPNPTEREYWGTDCKNGKEENFEKIQVMPDPELPLCAMAFKITDDTFGQLTYTRIYQGTLKKGQSYYNPRVKKSQRIGRLVRMHSDKREDITEAKAGDIIAMVGVDCASGDTYCDEKINVVMENIHVAEPVIELSIKPEKQNDLVKVSKALNRFMKEDPTFRVFVDPESNETIIAGMGELHLDIYVERIKREYKANVEIGRPKVHYREAPTALIDFNYKHKKQTGGSGQFAHIVGTIEPISEEADGSFEFINKTVGGSVPKEYVPGVERGFKESLVKGPVAGYQVVNTKIVLTDGTHHPVDSSEMAFKAAASGAFREGFLKTNPVILEPIMKVEIESPVEFQGPVQGDVSGRRGILIGSDTRNDYVVIIAEIPLSEMFGYSTELRSKTQGKATFTMEFCKYKSVPKHLQDKLVKEYQEAKAKK